MTYQFLDANSSILTAASEVVSAAHQPIVQIGSILTLVPVVLGGNASVSGTVGASIVGQLPAGTALIGSVATLQGTNPWIVVASISGQSGASIIGQLPAGTALLGSVATLQGTNPWVTTQVGSVAIQWQVPSIVGTYAEDAGHTSADKGLFVLGIRNDTVASFVSADLEYNGFSHDSAGRTLIKPFAPQESAIEGIAVLTSTSVTTMVAAAGTGLKNYITDIWFANTGAAATLVTLKDGAGSVLGYTIAPAGSGSNLQGLQVPIRTGANATFDIQATTATSTLYATVKGYRAP